MAEGLLRWIAGDRYEVHSAGSRPCFVHPSAIDAMSELGVDISGHRSKSMDEFAGRSFDYVITLCDSVAREVCPVLSERAKNRLHWSTPDPVGTDTFREVRDGIRARIEEWIKNSDD
jgi:arsenate reductase